MYLYEGFNKHKEAIIKTKILKKRVFLLLIGFFLLYPILISEQDSYSLSSPQPEFFKQYPVMPHDPHSLSLFPISQEAHKDEVPATVKGCVCSGQSFYSILIGHGFSSSAISECIEAFKPMFNCRKVSPGDEYEIVTDTHGDILTLTIKASPLDIYHLKRAGQKLVASQEEVYLDKKTVTISGEIDCSLFSAIADVGEKDELALKFADIFAWDIDFRHDLQKGDRFKIVFEKYFTENEFIRYGKILAAEYGSQDKIHRAIYFKDPEGCEDYYTPEGNSLRRSFIRSPLRFTRISSGYSYRRFHPILKKFRPHLGVDFSAPSGTLVWAVADGVVTWKGWKNGNGNTVTIRHPLGYETTYNHLSCYAKVINVGKRVKQKDTIGFVGTTGLSTGPHLDYRMKKNGKNINPLTEKFPPGFPVDQAYRTAFLAVSQQMLASLEKEPSLSHKAVARFQLLQ